MKNYEYMPLFAPPESSLRSFQKARKWPSQTVRGTLPHKAGARWTWWVVIEVLGPFEGRVTFPESTSIQQLTDK